MFISYNLVEFGEKLKDLRKNLGLSQLEIQRKAGVSADTLRRIEKGEVIPRYETMEILSSIYREDLLTLLKNARIDKLLYEYHDKLDELITFYDEEKMMALEEEIRKNFSSDFHESVINPDEVLQFLELIQGTSLYHSRFREDHEEAKKVLLKSLRRTWPDFTLRKYKNYKYSYIELRILLLLSILMAEKDAISLSTDILFFIRNRLENNATSTYHHHLIIKIYTNLCYNYHLEDNHEKVIEIADQGITYCLSLETTHGLNSLYYRKAIAEYQLGIPTYEASLQKAFFILNLTNNHSLLEVYQEVTKAQYGIDLKPYF